MMIALIAWGAMIGVDIAVLDPTPTVGKQTWIQLSEPVQEVRVTYQPDAPVARTFVLTTAGRKRVPWTPQRAGVVTIQAKETKKDLSVHFDGVPVSGVVVCVFAGLILFGGSLKSLYMLRS